MKKYFRIGFRINKDLAWKFFLLVVFPIHFWALIRWFLDFETISQRTNTWDAVGEGGYFLVYAFFESFVIFSLLYLLLLLLPQKLDQNIVFLTAATLYLVIAGWFMLEQIRFLPFIPEDNWVFVRLRSANSLHSNIGKVLAVVFLASLIIPPYLIVRFKKLRSTLSSLYERIGTLSFMYLFLDLAGFVIILLRIF